MDGYPGAVVFLLPDEGRPVAPGGREGGGCDAAQGYLFGGPVVRDAAERVAQPLLVLVLTFGDREVDRRVGVVEHDTAHIACLLAEGGGLQHLDQGGPAGRVRGLDEFPTVAGSLISGRGE